MTRIYTGRGDKGETDLWGSGDRVSKASPRIEAYGTIDELISQLGVVAAQAEPGIAADVKRIQQRLHVGMAQLADKEEKGDKQLSSDDVAALEDWIDEYQGELPWLDKFILPGGSVAGAALHMARAVCRRAERRIVALGEQEPVPETVVAYINRLSDLLFVMARYQNYVDEVDEHVVDYEG